MSLKIKLEENTFYSIDDIIPISDKKITDNYYILEVVNEYITEDGYKETKRMISDDFDFVLKTFRDEIDKFMDDVCDSTIYSNFGHMCYDCYLDEYSVSDPHFTINIYGANDKREMNSFKKFFSKFSCKK